MRRPAKYILALSSLLALAFSAYGVAGRSSSRNFIGSLHEPPRPRSYVSLEKTIKRDPFADAPKREPRLPKPRSTFDRDAFAELVALAAQPAQAQSDAALVLKATIVGDDPVAYLASGSELHLVRIGDAVGAQVVKTIDARGIALSDGTRLELVSLSRARAAPAAHWLQRRPNVGPHYQPGLSGSPQPSAHSSSPALAPTPAPPPTVKPGAYPLGSRPTSDPAAPTAFPYIYPYPPK